MGKKEGKKAKNPQLETIEPGEVAPLSEVLGEATAEEGKISWAPLKNPKIEGVLDHLAEGLLKIKGISMYRNPGKSDYFGFRVAKKGVAFIYLSAKKARVSVGEAVKGKNGKVKGSFPKHLVYKATESGFVWGDEKIKVSQIVKRTKDYIKARGWK